MRGFLELVCAILDTCIHGVWWGAYACIGVGIGKLNFVNALLGGVFINLCACACLSERNLGGAWVCGHAFVFVCVNARAFALVCLCACAVENALAGNNRRDPLLGYFHRGE